MFAWIVISIMFAASASSSIVEKTQPVIVVFDSRFGPFRTERMPNDTRADYQKALMAKNQLFIQQVFGSNRANIRPLWLINAAIVQASDAEAMALSSSLGVREVIWPRQRRLVHVEHEVGNIPTKFAYGLERLGIDALWETTPDLNGTGVRVGIIDTGIDGNHPDLADRVLGFRDFTSAADHRPRDDHGHGTHVAGTIAGGHTSGRAIGVAPGAHLLIAKAFDARGETSDLALFEAMHWLVDPDGNPDTDDGVHISSNSWSNNDKFSDKSPDEMIFCMAVRELAHLDVYPIFPSGNWGPDAATVETPGACPDAIAVGATDYDDYIWSDSSRGPAIWKNYQAIKPDVSAPGSWVYSAKPGGGYRHRSGTSMAVPHIAGLTALLLQYRPAVAAEILKAALYLGADDLGPRGIDNSFGNGRAHIMGSLKYLDAVETAPQSKGE